MAEPSELWAFLVVNVLVFGIGSLLTALSLTAYRSSGWSRAFRDATVGFGVLTIGSGADLVYEMGIKGDYHLTGRELLMLQTIEGLLVALGFGLLFYSIYRYRPARNSRPAVDRAEDVDVIEH